MAPEVLEAKALLELLGHGLEGAKKRWVRATFVKAPAWVVGRQARFSYRAKAVEALLKLYSVTLLVMRRSREVPVVWWAMAVDSL